MFREVCLQARCRGLLSGMLLHSSAYLILFTMSDTRAHLTQTFSIFAIIVPGPPIGRAISQPLVLSHVYKLSRLTLSQCLSENSIRI